MDDEDESWEAVWPPEPADNPELIRKAVAIVRDNPSMHVKAWSLVTESPGLGIDPGLTLLAELYKKSGSMVKSFIDQAIQRCFIIPIDADYLEDILLNYEEDSEDRVLELYTGCVWELTAMLASCIIHLVANQPLHASCFAPSERADFILAHR